MDALLKKLEEIATRDKEITEKMSDPKTYSDQKLMASLGKEQSKNRQIMVPYQELLEVLEHLKQADEVIKAAEDDELVELAEMEAQELRPKRDELVETLEVLLIPRDPEDDNHAIVEIRGAAGGDEGNIFAGDLYRMYMRYAENNGFKTEVLDASESEAGGFTQISFKVQGEGAYGLLKYESGSHRVQRVPKTETQGRIHTSTATVLVLPEIEEDDFELDMNDLEIEARHATGAGGQHVNKTSSAIRIVHLPTGITVNMQDGRSQHKNREAALEIIRARVYDYQQQEKAKEEGAVRKSKIGSGDRAEKIRTYNYPQNRISDHRIGLTLNQLDRVMDGKLGDVIEALVEADQRERLTQSGQ